MSGPPPPPRRPLGGKTTPVPSVFAASGAPLRPSARARLGAVDTTAQTPTTNAPPPPPPPAPAPVTSESEAEQAFTPRRVGNHFVSQVPPSPPQSDKDEDADGKPVVVERNEAMPTAHQVDPVHLPQDAEVRTSTPPPPPPPPPPPAAEAELAPQVAPQPQSQPAVSSRGPPHAPASIGEKDVLGFGLKPNALQLPSPVYLAEWVDETHILLGAGGGGRRFGMANILTIIRIDTTVNATSSSSPSAGGKTAKKPQKSDAKAVAGAALSDPASRMAHFVAATELGDDIPWCTSRFLPYDATEAALDDTLAAQVAQHCPDLVGFFAVSSITCFFLVGIVRGTPSAAYTLRLFARIVVPNDDRNPDKKPVALVHNALTIAHDGSGVLVYRLSSLLPPLGGGDATGLVEHATPLATWKLPARANDLHANRVNLVCAKKPGKAKATQDDSATPARGTHTSVRQRTPSRARTDRDGTELNPGSTTPRFVLHSPSPAKGKQNGGDTDGGDSPSTTAARAADASPSKEDGAPACRALLLNYLVIVAAVQDKTVRVGSLRLRRSRDEDGQGTPTEVTEQAALSGKDMGLAVPLMSSSLRLVRLFGLEDLKPAGQALARRALVLRDLGELPGASAVPLASLLVVVFSMQENQSYFIRATLDAALERGGGSGKADSRHGSLRVHVRLTEKPAPLVRDSITCLSPIADPAVLPATSASSSQTGPGSEAAVAAAAQNLFGAAVPRDWVVGCVEGWIARVRIPARDTMAPPSAAVGVPFVVAAMRPSRDKREAKRFPALHTEPVSCVAVSPSGVDVITTDIVQNVIISTLPPTPAPPPPAAAVAATTATASAKAASVVRQSPSGRGVAAHRTDIRLFPAETDDDSFWAIFSDFSAKERTMMFVLLSIIAVLLAMILS